MTPQFLFYLIVGILSFNYLLGRLLSYLNDKSFKSELPDELKGIYDEKKYKKSQEYDRVTGQFSLVTGTFSFAVMLCMLFLEGFAWVNDFVLSITDQPILQVLLFFGTLSVVSDIIGIPFSLYSTFVIEEKFGFNRTTLKTFIMDKIKGYFIGGLIGGGLLALFVWFYETAGDLFWVYAWIAIS